MAIYVRNCYGALLRLFVIGGKEIYSAESTEIFADTEISGTPTDIKEALLAQIKEQRGISKNLLMIGWNRSVNYRRSPCQNYKQRMKPLSVTKELSYDLKQQHEKLKSNQNTHQRTATEIAKE